jgi:hypothetical protein
MSLERLGSSRHPRVRPGSQASTPGFTGRALFVFVSLLVATLLVLPATALGQADPTAVPATAVPATAVPATTVPAPAPAGAPALTLVPTTDIVGAAVALNGTGYKPTELVEVSFNGQPLGSATANASGAFSLPFKVPSLAPGDYGVLAKGRNSELAATIAFTIKQGPPALAFSAPQATPATSLTITASSFQAGETVDMWFNGAKIGTETADTQGSISVVFVVPALAAGAYDVTATGQTSDKSVTVQYTVLAGPAPAATAAPTTAPAPAPAATPVPAPAQGAVAPAIAHDDRYFSQTGYRIDDDNVWGFFNQYGGLSTFGYPVSRMMSFLGCPVQMFQRQIIQVCPGSGAALINMLDPEIFPYTQVNGSTFPAADNTMKNSTPPVSSASYSTDISAFVQTNVPDTFGGQPVNFLQTFNTLGGLTIWGAPISNPQPDPANANFIYQRFQRGVMHFTVGTGTQSILLADYLKAIIMNQNVPTDLTAQARETRYFNQYCPNNPMWLCRGGDLPGTDLTFAFVNG